MALESDEDDDTSQVRVELLPFHPSLQDSSPKKKPRMPEQLLKHAGITLGYEDMRGLWHNEMVRNGKTSKEKNM